MPQSSALGSQPPDKLEKPNEKAAPAIAIPRLSPRVADLIDLVGAFALDEARSESELRERDRAIGLGLAATARSPRAAQKLLAWLRHVRSGASGHDWFALSSSAVLGVGAVFGVLAALGAFAFDGPAGRVNVVLVIALFVGLQWLGIVAALLSLAPWFQRIPVFGLLRGRGWEQLALRLAPREQRSRLEDFFGRNDEVRALYGELRNAVMLRWSQLAATGFCAAALIWMIGLVVFTDLAFGWSTTLDVSAAEAHALVVAISRPWSSLWPAGVPSLELIEATRFFRVAPDAGIRSAELLGRWWPFVVATVSCYALLPRLVLLVISGRRLRRAVVDTFEAVPGAQRTLARLDAAVATRAQSAELEGAPAGETGPAVLAALPARAGVVDWADALGAARASESGAGSALGIDVGALAAAGGHLELAADREAIVAMARSSLPVVVAVRGFETPMLELRDFLADLRRGIGPERNLTLALTGEVDDVRVGAWFRWLAGLRDSEVTLAVATQVASESGAGATP